jgi:hypothetical protein
LEDGEILLFGNDMDFGAEGLEKFGGDSDFGADDE